MADAAICCLLLAFAQTPTTKPADYPPDWPPLPDFRTPIDYIDWYNETVYEKATDNAAPLWEELGRERNDSDQSLLWGEDEEGELHGLLSGWRNEFDGYAWDPVDHPKWETAFVLRLKHGLRDKLQEILEHEQLVYRVKIPDELSEDESDIGFTRNDQLLIRAHFPSISVQRAAAKVTLEDAWRIYRDSVSGWAMLNAIKTNTRIARQAERGRPGRISGLVALVIYDLTCSHMIRALDEGVLDHEQMNRLWYWLVREDSDPILPIVHLPYELAGQLDLLQFLYLPSGPGCMESTRLNERNARLLIRMQKHIAEQYKLWEGQLGPEEDVINTLKTLDPVIARNRIVSHTLQMKKAYGQVPVRKAATEMQRLTDTLKSDLKGCAPLLQLDKMDRTYVLLLARGRSHHQAAKIIVALHLTKENTGAWPASLGTTRPLLRHADRIDPFTGEEFIYRLENGEPLLYSVGYDGVDNGGKHHRRAWSDDEEAVGTDYVFWPVPDEDRR